MPTLDEIRRWAQGEKVDGFPDNASKSFESIDSFRKKNSNASQDAKKRYKVSTSGDDAILFFGKHSGKTVSWLAENDLPYLSWLYTIAEVQLADVIRFVTRKASSVRRFDRSRASLARSR